jgi:hypothetical protein
MKGAAAAGKRIQSLGGGENCRSGSWMVLEDIITGEKIVLAWKTS